MGVWQRLGLRCHQGSANARATARTCVRLQGITQLNRSDVSKHAFWNYGTDRCCSCRGAPPCDVWDFGEQAAFGNAPCATKGNRRASKQVAKHVSETDTAGAGLHRQWCEVVIDSMQSWDFSMAHAALTSCQNIISFCERSYAHCSMYRYVRPRTHTCACVSHLMAGSARLKCASIFPSHGITCTFRL